MCAWGEEGMPSECGKIYNVVFVHGMEWVYDGWPYVSMDAVWLWQWGCSAVIPSASSSPLRGGYFFCVDTFL